MCFKAPKPPKVVDPVADPDLYRQRQDAELALAEQKRADKQTRTEQQLAVLAGRIGRKSLFSGGQGGVGFGSRWSQIAVPPVVDLTDVAPSQPVTAPAVDPVQTGAPASGGGGGGGAPTGNGSGAYSGVAVSPVGGGLSSIFSVLNGGGELGVRPRTLIL